MNPNSKFQSFTNKAALLWVLVFGIWNLGFSETPADLYKKAAAAYKANDFENARAAYEKILELNYKPTAEVYFNLGNCYYKLNNTGHAILNYERALKLNPNDEDIQHNLKLAEQKTVDKIQAVPQLTLLTWWKGFRCSQSAGGWSIFAAVALWLAFAGFAAYLFTGYKKITAFAGTLMLVLAIGFGLLAISKSNHDKQSTEAVLLASSAYVKSAPDVKGTDVFMVHEGIKFRILDNVGTWYKIRLADGKTGWLENTSFSRI